MCDNLSVLEVDYLYLVVLPQGVRGYFIALVRPPWGWSTGFLATPLDRGALPYIKLDLALVLFTLKESCRDDLPKEPTEKMEITFLTPEGNLTKDKPVLGSIFISFEEVPGLRDNFEPKLGWTSKLLTCACRGNCKIK